MAILFLPCGGGSDITHRVNLDGKEYDFRFRYLQRETNVATGTPIYADEWKLYIALTGGSTILETSLKTNRDLLAPYQYRTDCPQGVMILRDTVADNSLFVGDGYFPERVGFNTLGIDKRFRLVYFTPDEIQ